MAQQVGSGAAPAASETEPAPGGASGMTEADPRQNGTKAGRGGQRQWARPRREAGGGRQGDGRAKAGGASRGRRPARRHQGRPCPRLAAAATPRRATVTTSPRRRTWWRPGPNSTWPRTTRWSAICSARPAPWTSRASSCESPALSSPAGSRRRPGGPADLLGQPGGPAQPRAETVGTRLLHGRSAAAQLTGRLRGPGHARRPAGQAAAGRSQAAGADRAGAEDRADHPAAVPPEEPARPAQLARGRVLPPGPDGRRRLLRLHPAAGRAGHVRGRRRHRQGRAGRAGHGEHARAAAGRGAPADLARARFSATSTTCSAWTSRRTCSSPAWPWCSTRSAARSSSPTPATTCRTCGPGTACGS